MSVFEIYYADDDIDDIDMFREAVKKISEKNIARVDLHVYNNGDVLLKSIREKKPKNGTVFLDINMPGKTGFQVLDEIKKDPDLNKIPVIMYSTSSDDNAISVSQSLGASLYAVKPTDFKELNAMIRQVVAINWDEYNYDGGRFVIGNTFG